MIHNIQLRYLLYNSNPATVEIFPKEKSWVFNENNYYRITVQ